MTKDNLVTAPENTTLEAAERILTENKVEKLLLVDENYKLKGLITIKDIDKLTNFPKACKDKRGRLRVGAAVGVHDYERAESLIQAGVDVLVVDSAHGHSAQRARDGDGAQAALRHRRDRRQRGHRRRGAGPGRGGGGRGQGRASGPGSICTTRVISGVGVPQITAIYQAAAGHRRQRRADHRRRRHSLFRRHHQGAGGRRPLRHARQPVRRAGGEPGPDDHLQGTQLQDLSRHGFASAPWWPAPSDRYQQGNGAGGKLVPGRGRRARALQGPAGPFVYQLVGGLRAGMGYCGTRNIEELRTRTRFILVSGASVQESHPHDIVITQESPNYSSAEYAGTDGS